MTTILATAFPLLLAATNEAGIPDSIRPIIFAGMALGFCGIGIAFTAIITDAKIKRTRLETIRVALEKGVALPDVLDPQDRPSRAWHDRLGRPRNDRRAGVNLVMLSVGLFIFFRMLGLGAVAYLSVITLCIGVALLLNAFLDRRDAAKQPSRDGQP